MHLRVGTRGSSRLTTSRPSLAIVAALRYLLTSFKLLSFLMDVNLVGDVHEYGVKQHIR